MSLPNIESLIMVGFRNHVFKFSKILSEQGLFQTKLESAKSAQENRIYGQHRSRPTGEGQSQRV
jgi:hypothetical protein